MNELEEVVSEFARAVDQVTRQVPGLGLDQVIQLYDEVETDFLPRVSGNDHAVMEFRRRIAESKFYLLIERNRPLEEVVSFYDAVRKLGFGEIERRATVDTIFAKYCLRNGNTERGTKLLKELSLELNDAIATNDLEIYRHLNKLVEKILEENMP